MENNNYRYENLFCNDPHYRQTLEDMLDLNPDRINLKNTDKDYILERKGIEDVQMMIYHTDERIISDYLGGNRYLRRNDLLSKYFESRAFRYAIKSREKLKKAIKKGIPLEKIESAKEKILYNFKEKLSIAELFYTIDRKDKIKDITKNVDNYYNNFKKTLEIDYLKLDL